MMFRFLLKTLNNERSKLYIEYNSCFYRGQLIKRTKRENGFLRNEKRFHREK